MSSFPTPTLPYTPLIASPHDSSIISHLLAQSVPVLLRHPSTYDLTRKCNCPKQISAFNDFHVDKHLDFSELAILSYVTAIIYITLCTVELFGSVVNVLPRRLHLIETYTRLVDISAVLVAVAGLTYSGTYLVYKDELVSECAHLNTHDEGLIRSTFRLNPWPTSTANHNGGWLHFARQSPFARLRALLPWRTSPKYQRLPSTEPHTNTKRPRDRDHTSLHKLQSVPSLHPIKEAPEAPSPVSPVSPGAGLTPGPPSYGGAGHGYNLHNGHLSAFTIGSLDTGMEDDSVF
ncbi:hypothetical protein EYR40_000163 [Pleurotus pulmonarius]|nr:hypothetical protein EYR36_001478 [Pleurotus pulmonarius]KAF4607827.1 hypothetical protein EYR40_000163 [Pleurotus pulmonarius]